jgi:hypothetical protein
LDMFLFITDQELWARELTNHIMGCGNSLSQNDILKFVYYFMIIFLIIYIFKHCLLLVPFSHQGSVIIFSF